MSDEVKFTESSGNIFADLDLPNADKLLDRAAILSKFNSTQQAPKPNDPHLPISWDLVKRDFAEMFKDESSEIIEDISYLMSGRDTVGLNKYGIRLQPHNGRNQLIDAFQEYMDGAVYLRTAIENVVVTANTQELSMLVDMYVQTLNFVFILFKLISAQ